MDTKPPRANLLQTAGQRTAAGAKRRPRRERTLAPAHFLSMCWLHLHSPFTPDSPPSVHVCIADVTNTRRTKSRCQRSPLWPPRTCRLRGCSTSGLKRHSDRQQSPPRSGQSSFTSPPPLNHTPNSTLWRLLENLTPTFVSLFRSCLRLFCGTGFIPSKPKHFLVTSILN